MLVVSLDCESAPRRSRKVSHFSFFISSTIFTACSQSGRLFNSLSPVCSRSSNPPVCQSTAMALWLGQRVCGLKLQQLAEHAGLSHYWSVSTALRYLQARLVPDATLSRLLSQAKRQLSNMND